MTEGAHGRSIWDSQLRLITAAVDTKIDFCNAIAWDVQARKFYYLLDKLGIEK